MVTWNLDCTQLTTAVFENFLQRKKNVWIKRSSLKIKRVLQPPGAERSFATPFVPNSFNDMEHQPSSTATRVEKSALTLAVENGLWRLSLC